MKRFMQFVIVSLLTSISLVASNIEVDRVGLHVGIAHSSLSQENTQGTIVLDTKPDTTFTPIVEIYTTLSGVFEDDATEPFLSYTDANNSDFRHQYFLVGINKYFTHKSYDLYAGVYSGYSFLKWEYNPLNNTVKNDTRSISPLAGLQAGCEFALSQNLSFDFNIKWMLYNHITELETSTAKAELKSRVNFFSGVGLVYKFNYFIPKQHSKSNK